MCEAPGSVVTLLCSGIQLYSAERRIADCILADVKRDVYKRQALCPLRGTPDAFNG